MHMNISSKTCNFRLYHIFPDIMLYLVIYFYLLIINIPVFFSKFLANETSNWVFNLAQEEFNEHNYIKHHLLKRGQMKKEMESI